MTFNYFTRHKTVWLYGASLALLLFMMKWLEWRFIIADYAFEIYAGLIAVLFTALGIWLALKLTKPQTVVVEKQIIVKADTPFQLNEQELTRLGLSRRELEVLQLMSGGLSNQEIADRMFVSLNTIKTHSSRVFEKLEVQRRTQAVEKARRLGLIP